MQNEYTQMVRDLAKDGQAIINDMTPMNAHYLHMAIGVAGETGELAIAVANQDAENILEECGDIEFYLEGIVDYVTPVLGLDVADIVAKYPQYGLPSTNTSAAWKIAAEMLDITKKAAMYAKPIKEDELAMHCVMLRSWLDLFYQTHDLTQEQVREHNMNKLLKGKNARYKEGTFSNEAAQNRADKAAECLSINLNGVDIVIPDTETANTYPLTYETILELGNCDPRITHTVTWSKKCGASGGLYPNSENGLIFTRDNPVVINCMVTGHA